MKKVLISVISLALGVALTISVIIPVLNHARGTGGNAYQTGKTIGVSIKEILK